MDSYDTALTGLVGGVLIFYIILLLVIVAAAIVGIIAIWKLFNKAGKKGWQSIIPIYSYWVLIEIAGLNWWWFLLIICDNVVSLFDIEGLSTVTNLVSLFASFNCYYNIAKKFNKETGYSVCAGIFSYIFILIFGFSKKEVYDANIPVSKNGVFGKPEVTTYNNVNNNYQNNTYQNNIYPQPVSNDTVNNASQEVNNQNTAMNSNVEFNNQEVSYCGNCGTKMVSGTRFCPNCGKEKL